MSTVRSSIANTSPTLMTKDFLDTIARDVRGTLPVGQRKWLHSKEMIEDRYLGLAALKRDVEGQLAHWRAKNDAKRLELEEQGDDGTLWLEYKAEHLEWRSRAVFFLHAIENHLQEAKRILKQSRIHSGESSTSEDLLIELAKGVVTSLESRSDGDISPEEQKVLNLAQRVRTRTSR